MGYNNRKKGKQSGHAVPVPFVLVIVMGAALSLVYLWLGSRCDLLGKELKELEAINRDVTRKCMYEESRWAYMISPVEIAKALNRHNLPIAWPSRAQIVHVSSSDVVDAFADVLHASRSQYAGIHRVAMND